MTAPHRNLRDLERATLVNTLRTLADHPLTPALADRLTSLDPLLLVGVSAAAAGDDDAVHQTVARFLELNGMES